MNRKDEEKLQDLLEKSPPESMTLNDGDVEWLHLAPLGKEDIEEEQY